MFQVSNKSAKEYTTFFLKKVFLKIMSRQHDSQHSTSSNKMFSRKICKRMHILLYTKYNFIDIYVYIIYYCSVTILLNIIYIAPNDLV